MRRNVGPDRLSLRELHQEADALTPEELKEYADKMKDLHVARLDGNERPFGPTMREAERDRCKAEKEALGEDMRRPRASTSTLLPPEEDPFYIASEGEGSEDACKLCEDGGHLERVRDAVVFADIPETRRTQRSLADMQTQSELQAEADMEKYCQDIDRGGQDLQAAQALVPVAQERNAPDFSQRRKGRERSAP